MNAQASLVLAMGVLIAAPASSQAIPSGPSPAFNVILIVLDDLGTDQLALYGENPSACARTPHLAALRDRGLLFTNAIVNPMCSPTRSTLMTGRYGFRTGVGLALDPGTQYALPSSEIFLPEILPSTYACGAFGKWHLTTLSHGRCHAVDNGFDRAQICLLNGSGHYRWSKVTNDSSDWATVIVGPTPGTLLTPCASTIVGAVPVGGSASGFSARSWSASVARLDAFDWIKSLPAGERFFAYVNFNPPHAPEQVPPFELLSSQTLLDMPAGLLSGPLPPSPLPTLAQRQQVYDLMIEAIDTDIGRLLDGLDAFDPAILEQTVVIVIGDNGTPMDMIVPPQNPAHGKRTLYRGGTRVPLLVSGPESLIAPQHHGSCCNALVNGVDVWRTVANLAGLSDTDIDTYVQQQFSVSHPIDGVSMLPLFQDPIAASIREYAFSESFASGPPPVPIAQHSRMVTDGLYTYIVTPNGPIVEELYHVANSMTCGDWNDPNEADNLLLHPSLLTEEQDALCRLKNEMNEIIGGGSTCP